jgi:chromosomal replication initiator protein
MWAIFPQEEVSFPQFWVLRGIVALQGKERRFPMQEQDYQETWDAIRDQVKQYEGVNAAQTDAFFSRLHLQAFATGFIMLTADNDFIKKWIERQYSTLINRALVDLYGVPFTVEIEVDELGAVKTLAQAQEQALSAREEESAPEPSVAPPAPKPPAQPAWEEEPATATASVARRG